MLKRTSRVAWKPLVAIAIATMVVTGVAFAYAYTVVFGTPGNDVIDESGQPGNFHIYGFQGSDTITGGLGDITTSSNGQPVINGYDIIYGDGECSETPPGNDSYCEHPLPWLPQPWTDAVTDADVLTGGAGPEWVIGGGGNNVITGSQTYDVITGGPHINTIVGSQLGGAIIANQPGADSNIKLLPTTLKRGYKGLIGIPYFVDVYNGRTSGNTIRCFSPANYDFVWANRGDTVINCYKVYYSAPVFPPASNANFALPPGMGGNPTNRDIAETLVSRAEQALRLKVSSPIIKSKVKKTEKHSAKKHHSTRKHRAAKRH
jgi:hypothetical protein